MGAAGTQPLLTSTATPADTSQLGRFRLLKQRALAFGVRVQVPVTLALLAILFLWALYLSYRVSVLSTRVEQLQQHQNTATAAANVPPVAANPTL